MFILTVNLNLQPTLSSYKDQYNISWTVQSYSPIREYRLFYRIQATTRHIMHHDKPIDNHISSSHIYNPYGTSLSDQWENIVIPEMFNDYTNQYHSQSYHYNQNFRHRMSFPLKNLSPSSNYEVRVQARNDHGWNKLSNIFHFSTRSEGKEKLTSLIKNS